jgi:starch synthase
MLQLYAMRYGALPLVHATGGLADSVIDARQRTVGNGFVFTSLDEAAAVRALTDIMVLRNTSGRWRSIMRHAMTAEVGWNRSAQAYEKVFVASLQQAAGQAGTTITLGA